uniref:Uncharacterized protein n=1 Tax=Anguilla anguilla TaxID=7936 RepID=A0A0E9QKT6_ANGAN
MWWNWPTVYLLVCPGNYAWITLYLLVQKPPDLIVL